MSILSALELDPTHPLPLTLALECQTQFSPQRQPPHSHSLVPTKGDLKTIPQMTPWTPGVLPPEAIRKLPIKRLKGAQIPDGNEAGRRGSSKNVSESNDTESDEIDIGFMLGKMNRSLQTTSLHFNYSPSSTTVIDAHNFIFNQRKTRSETFGTFPNSTTINRFRSASTIASWCKIKECPPFLKSFFFPFAIPVPFQILIIGILHTGMQIRLGTITLNPCESRTFNLG